MLGIETIIFEPYLLNNLPDGWLVRCAVRSMPHLSKLGFNQAELSMASSLMT